MMKNHSMTALEQLNTVIDNTVSHINDFTTKPTDFTRNRKLNASVTIKVTLNMQGNSLNTELIDAFPDLNDRVTASAYEQAKGKLKPSVFRHIFDEFNETLVKPKLLDGKYRVFAIDGSDFNLPYNSESEYIVQGNKDIAKPYSQIHVNALFDLENRIYQDCIFQARSAINERDAAIDMIKRLDVGKHIVIMDRGYDGFNMIENFNRIKDCYYVIRTKAGKGGIKEICNLPDEECDEETCFQITTSHRYYIRNHIEQPYLHLIHSPKKHYKEYISTNTRNIRWDFNQFCNVKCRVVKFRINDNETGKEEWEVILTNLNRYEFPVSRIKNLYHKRWDIETSFRQLKYSLGGVQFHSKKDDFAEMELYSHLIMFNVVSRDIIRAKTTRPVNNKHDYAVSFKDACTITRKYFRLHSNAPPDNIYAEMLAYIVPIRLGRSNKRNVRAKSTVWFTYRVA